MRKLCRQGTQAVIWPLRAEELPEVEDRFSVITCLWNVLGHVETNQKRLTALTRMRRLLSDDGVIFIDVNNRYNAVNYGVLPTIGRMLYDFIAPAETNGNAQVTWRFGEQQNSIADPCLHSTGDCQAPRRRGSDRQTKVRSGLPHRSRSRFDLCGPIAF